jgi:hypothetical protein
MGWNPHQHFVSTLSQLFAQVIQENLTTAAGA